MLYFINVHLCYCVCVHVSPQACLQPGKQTCATASEEFTQSSLALSVYSFYIGSWSKENNVLEDVLPSVAQEHSLLKPKECEKSPFSCLCCLFSLSPIFWTLKPTFLIFISPWRLLHFLTALLCLGLRHQGIFKYNTHTPPPPFLLNVLKLVMQFLF